MLTLHGFDFSTPANKVRFLANHGGVEYAYTKLDPKKGELATEAHLLLHPAGKVPVIEDDGYVLFESNAIMKYLARKHDLPVYPKANSEQAIVDQWLDFVSIHLGNAMHRVFGNRFIFPMLEMEVDERSLQDGLKFLERFLPIIDKQLEKTGYLAGDALTIADFNLIATTDPAELAEVDLAPYATLTAYRARLTAEDFYTKCFNAYSDCFSVEVG